MSYMARALALARNALGSAGPNPPVGALVVKDGVVVGEGWTQPPGEDHAEIVALRQAGPLAAGAKLYTTLEPCNHQGRTPPCSEAIIEAGVSDVHAATLDPNASVAGGGIARLEEAGITTSLGEGEAEARKLMEAYLHHCTTGLPFVTAKFAMSLDGKIATRTGDSKWITGEEARRYANRLRAASDAVMVGINTVLADDPLLTARDDRERPLDRQPLRLVVDGRGRIPKGAKLLGQPGRTVLATAYLDSAKKRQIEGHGVEVESVPAADGSVELRELLRRLGHYRRITSMMVEGGAALLGSLFDGGLVDKVVAFVAPTIIGGDSAPSAVAGAGVGRMADALRLGEVEVIRLGKDIAMVGYCKAKEDVHGNR